MPNISGPIKDRKLNQFDLFFAFIFIFILLVAIVICIIIEKYADKTNLEGKILFTIVLFAFLCDRLMVVKKHLTKHINVPYSNRKNTIKNYIKRNNVKYLPEFDKPIKENPHINFFYPKENISFNDVFIEEINNDTCYIGDLEWSTYEVETQYNYEIDNKKYFSSDKGVHYRESKKVIKHETKHLVTMCVLFDDSFSLPDFQIRYETLKDKILDYLDQNDVKDIDFSSDKAFSDKWLLSTNESENIVRDLFNQNIRSCFMKIDNKEYIICARRNMFYIIILTPVGPEKYYSIAKDLVVIRDFLKNNKKYYKVKKQ